MENPKVSIIIPTYRRPQFVRKAIESALAQTYRPLEVIVVSDNEPDDEFERQTSEIVAEYVGNNKLVYLPSEGNLGGAKARNRGLSIATGDYVNFYDDDDYLYPDKIKDQMAKAKKYDYRIAVVGCCAFIKDENGKIVRAERPIYDSSDILFSELKANISTTSLSLVHRETCLKSGGWKPIESSQEHLFLIGIFEVNPTFDYVDKTLVDINWHTGERISNRKKRPIGMLKLTKIIESYYNRFDDKKVEILKLSRLKYDTYAYILLREWGNALKCFINRMKISFFDIDNIKILYFFLTYVLNYEK